ncbi:MAG: hypothetical protein RL477_1013 [Pseudomonadota bacterium]|jgi:tripartite-type tricarboxylate transporter receptor subunit TctC
MYFRLAAAAALAALGSIVPDRPASADAAADFYKGKHISILVSSTAGSGYDTYARLLGRNLGKHVPGKPGFTPRNMPGAGGMIVANTAAQKGPNDGTMIFTLHFTLPLYQAMGGKGVMFDAGKFIGLGRLLASASAMGVWTKSKSGVLTVEDAKKREVILGATGSTSNSVLFPYMMNNMIGTKFKVVSGYSSGDTVMLAMERGEIDGFGAYSYLTFKSTKPDYIDKKQITALVQFGLKREPDWADVPTGIELATNEADRKAMEAATVGPEIGFSYFMPAGVPADRAKALRAGFDAMVKDAAFLADARRAHLDLRPASGAEIEAIVDKALGAPKEAIDRLRNLMIARGGVRCQDFGDKALCAKAKNKAQKAQQSSE